MVRKGVVARRAAISGILTIANAPKERSAHNLAAAAAFILHTAFSQLAICRCPHLQGVVDMLHPDTKKEKSLHKKKRLVQVRALLALVRESSGLGAVYQSCCISLLTDTTTLDERTTSGFPWSSDWWCWAHHCALRGRRPAASASITYETRAYMRLLAQLFAGNVLEHSYRSCFAQLARRRDAGIAALANRCLDSALGMPLAYRS